MAAVNVFSDRDNGATRLLVGVMSHPVIDVGVIGPKSKAAYTPRKKPGKSRQTKRGLAPFKGAKGLSPFKLENAKKGPKGATAKAKKPAGKKGPTIQQIAGWNEFGTKGHGGNTPPRSFVGLWFDMNLAAMKTFIDKASIMLAHGTLKPPQFIRLVGEKAVGGIKKHMSSGIAPRNADSTIARKGSSTTLIDRGTMRSAVSYQEFKTGGK